MLDLFFADDSRQRSPTRDGMRGPLLSAGGVHVPAANVRSLEDALNEACERAGFPDGPVGEFKWSPGRDLWMWDNLVGDDRAEFFEEVLEIGRDHDIRAIVVVNDTVHDPAEAPDHQSDVTSLLLERFNWRLRRKRTQGIVVVDRPSGGRGDEDKFLLGCLETLTGGTTYVSFDRIALNVLSTPSRLMRSLQLADLVTSCTTALVAGEDRYAPVTFPHVREILWSRGGLRGGTGLKIHPSYYLNLYHWLAGDEVYRKRNTGMPLPMRSKPYADTPDSYH